MTQIHWNGDFSNEAKSGVIVARNNGLLTIQWDCGQQQIVPEFVTKGAGWRVG